MRTTRRARRAATRLYRACLVDGRLDEGRAMTAVRRLAETRRRGTLAVLSYFLRLARLDRARHQAVVESASPLPADLSVTLEAAVRLLYGTGVDVSFIDNADLIGGVRVRIGSDVYDGSVRTALASLEQRF